MSSKLYRLLAVLSVLSLLLAGAAAPASPSPWKDKVDPWVLQTAAEGDTEFLVYLTTQADLERGWIIIHEAGKGQICLPDPYIHC